MYKKVYIRVMHTYGACRTVSMRTINLFRTAVKSYRRGEFNWGGGLIGPSFIYNLMFLRWTMVAG